MFRSHHVNCEIAPETLLEKRYQKLYTFLFEVTKKSTNLCSVASSAVPGPCSQKPLVYFDTEKDEQDEGYQAEEDDPDSIDVVLDVHWVVSEIRKIESIVV